MAGCERDDIVRRTFFEFEDVPAGVDVVEIRGDTAVDQFDADYVFEGAAKRPAKGICCVVGHEIAVTTIDGDSHGALFSSPT